MERCEEGNRRLEASNAFASGRTLAIIGAIAVGAILWATMTGDTHEVDQGPPEFRRSLGKLASELAAAGFPVDLDAVNIRVVADEDMAEECYAWMNVPNSRRRTLHAVGRALGVKNLPNTAEEAHEAEAKEMGQWLGGFFDFPSSTLVFPKRSVDSSSTPQDEVDFYFLHELAHAWQGERLGIANRSTPETTEDALITQCLVEGQAEVIALLTSLRRRDRGLESVDPHEVFAFGPTQSNFADLRLPYTLGARAFLSAIQATGVAAMRDPWSLGYSSTEQIMHPEKVDDEPTQVLLPPPEGDDWEEDTLGELAIYHLLQRLSFDSDNSFQAAGGWDGDRLRWEHHGDESALLWRVVFDRDKDAAQFKRAIHEHEEISVQQHANRIDLAWGTTEAACKAASARLLSDPFDHYSSSGEARIAEAIPDSAPWLHRVRFNTWRTLSADEASHDTYAVPGLGLELKARGNFVFDSATNASELRSDALLANTTAQGVLYFGERSLDGARSWLASRLTKPEVETLEFETVEVSGQEALLASWRVDIDDAQMRWHLGLVVLRGARIILIQIVSLSEAPGEDAREMLLSAKFD